MKTNPKKLFLNKRKRILKSAFLIVSLFSLGSLGLHLTSYLLRFVLPETWIGHPLYTLSVVSLIFAFLFKPLDHFYAELVRRYFFNKKSSSHITLMNLLKDLETVLDMQELANLVVNTFADVFNLKSVSLLIREKEQCRFVITSAFGRNISDYRKVILPEDSETVRLIYQEKGEILVRHRVTKFMNLTQANEVAQELDFLQASWLVPLFYKEELVGILCFSSYQPKKLFNDADFHFFKQFAKALSKRIWNAMTFSELKRSNKNLQDTQSKLVQVTKLAAIEQLATGLAHQIHNPLTIISGKAQVLLLQKDRVPLDSRVQDVLKTIVKQTKRAADITKKLLMFSQSLGEHKEELQLEHVLEDTLSLISYQTSLDRIEITKTVQRGMPPVFANLQEMREVFFNLLLNAVQSLGESGKVHVEMLSRLQEQVIEIRVSDTGAGIDEDDLDKLFNPFFTTRHEGLGLGLFVTKQIIHRLGGEIRAESYLNEGSLFIVRLPIGDVENFDNKDAPNEKVFGSSDKQ